MAYTIVHCADVHLETTFRDARGGAYRRSALADAFVRVVDEAIARNADALTIGGDLYEAERAGPQTARFLATAFARFGKPVFVAPGNHDPYGPQHLLARGAMPPNVRVFDEAAWRPYALAEGITLWGFGHTGAEPGRPFAGTRFDREGVQIAIVHGSDEERCPPGKRATAPFTADEVAASGASLVLTGHYHGGYTVEREGKPLVAYPGSLEPIKFGEGAHGMLVVRVADDGAIALEHVNVGRTRLIDLTIPCDGATDDRAIKTTVAAALAAFGTDDFVRARLTGMTAPGTRVEPDLLADAFPHLGSLAIVDDTDPCDPEELAQERTVRGHSIGDLLQLARSAPSDSEERRDAERALRLVALAFTGGEIAP
jgi:DNA repair exonuclease SbcCD nuclease subunit